MGDQVGRTLAVTSGKGGVGKSCIAVNLAVSMARRGRSTLLVDADFGLGNSALLLGCGVEHTIEDVLRGTCRAAEAAVGGRTGIIPSVAGWARMTGYNTIFIDDRDPFAHGFVVK